MEKTCGQCGLKAIKGGMCPIFGALMDENEAGCPYFNTEVEFCDICGQLILKNCVIDIDDSDTAHKLCASCANADLCVTCEQRPHCAFVQDQSCKEPPNIMKQMRQGNMVMQAQVPNPKRIEATCAKGCPCYWPDGLEDGTYCCKQNGCGGCKNYNPNWRK